MDPFDFVFGGGTRLEDLEMIDQTADFDQIAEATLRFRIFVWRTGLHAEAWRHQARRSAGVVPHIEFVTEPTRRHLPSPPIVLRCKLYAESLIQRPITRARTSPQ